ncbi:hypothetical protein AGLY_017275 [Aphis glycines]|uniref:Reverse transcriptase domain-containing protein n=1 Tax=Aphis glycines TaxID=307491 RepID=A0A6G0SVI7_APHGL|nr:hypothetical protein AGLY_017275 [Aphis glycines]
MDNSRIDYINQEKGQNRDNNSIKHLWKFMAMSEKIANQIRIENTSTMEAVNPINIKNNNENITENSLKYTKFTHKEISLIMNTLKQGTSPGFDSITSNLLLQISDYVIKLLTHLINLSFEKDINGNILDFADDTVLFFEGETWTEVENKANAGQVLVNNWYAKNSLMLNKEKSVDIPFALSSFNKPDQMIIKLHNNNCKISNVTDICNPNRRYLSRVVSTKYLGVIFDEHLKWETRVEMELRTVLDTPSLKIVYFALIQSILMYGLIVWGSAYNNNGLDVVVKNINDRNISKCFYLKNILSPNNKIIELGDVKVLSLTLVDHV